MIFINCTVDKSTGLFRPFFPVSLPFGIAYLIAVLRKEDIPCAWVDQQIHRRAAEKALMQRKQFQLPAIYCLSFLTEAASEALRIAAQIKSAEPEAIVITGGIHSTALPEALLVHPCIDFVFTGEAEGVIAELARRLIRGSTIADLPGVASREHGKIRINERAPVVEDLDQIPIIPYEDFATHKRYDLGYFSFSRGCPYQCAYCNNNLTGSRRCRFKSTARALEEMELLINRYGCRELYFYDDNFLTHPVRVRELCEGIREKGLHQKARFSFQSRAKDAQPEILREIFNAGFKTIFFGVETVSDELLNAVGKKETAAETVRAITLARETGFKVIANYMFCLPGETQRQRRDCVTFSIRHQVDVVKFNNVVPYPGTQLYNDHLNTPLMRPPGDFSTYNSQLVLVSPFWRKVRFPLLPGDVSDRAIRTDTLYAYLRFYTRPRMIWRMFTRRDWGGLVFRMGDSRWNIVRKIPAALLLMADLAIKVIWFIFMWPFSGNGRREKC